MIDVKVEKYIVSRMSNGASDCGGGGVIELDLTAHGLKCGSGGGPLSYERLVKENQELADALRVCVDALEMMVSKHNDVSCGSDSGLRLSCPPAEMARKLLDEMDD